MKKKEEEVIENEEDMLKDVVIDDYTDEFDDDDDSDTDDTKKSDEEESNSNETEKTNDSEEVDEENDSIEIDDYSEDNDDEDSEESVDDVEIDDYSDNENEEEVDSNEIEKHDNDSKTENTKEENSNLKKSNKLLIIIVVIMALLIIVLSILLFTKKDNNKEKDNNNSNSNTQELKKLPKPEITGGERGKLGIDKNINESNIDEYLGRDDAVYRDMRMLEDPAKYESIGGDRFLSGYIKGFEIVPLPYILPVTGLPEAVGKTYQGKTLFGTDKNGSYVANYEESRKILEELFPKDKVIFLMCGGGGYAGMMRAALISLGWDENKIYNIGGYWYYEGKNKIDVKKNGNKFDFSDVPYHDINFDKLTPIKGNDTPGDKAIALTSKYYNKNLVTNLDKITYDEIDEWYEKESQKIDYEKLCPKKEINIDDYNNIPPGTESNSNENEEENEDECPAFDEAYDKLNAEYDKKAEEITLKKLDAFNRILDSDETFIITFDEGHRCGEMLENDPRGYMFDIADKYNLYVYDIGFDVYKKSRLFKKVKYAPGVIIYSNGEIIAYTDAESDDQKGLYNDIKEFKKWLTEYVKITKE